MHQCASEESRFSAKLYVDTHHDRNEWVRYLVQMLFNISFITLPLHYSHLKLFYKQTHVWLLTITKLGSPLSPLLTAKD